jgi:hypothetical protein
MSTIVSRGWSSFTLACIVVALTPPQLAPAQSLEEAVRACVAEPDVLRRLRCYDQAAGQLVGAQVPAGVPTSSAADKDESRTESPEARFGLRNGPLDERKYATAPKEITATVILIEMRRSSGALVVSLDNDQVWVQNQATEYFPLRVGDTVRIRSAAMGSYMLFAPSKRATRVTRIR